MTSPTPFPSFFATGEGAKGDFIGKSRNIPSSSGFLGETPSQTVKINPPTDPEWNAISPIFSRSEMGGGHAPQFDLPTIGGAHDVTPRTRKEKGGSSGPRTSSFSSFSSSSSILSSDVPSTVPFIQRSRRPARVLRPLPEPLQASVQELHRLYQNVLHDRIRRSSFVMGDGGAASFPSPPPPPLSFSSSSVLSFPSATPSFPPTIPPYATARGGGGGGRFPHPIASPTAMPAVFPTGGMGGPPSAGLVELCEAYRHAAIDPLLGVPSSTPRKDGRGDSSCRHRPTESEKESFDDPEDEEEEEEEEIEMASYMWLLVSFFLRFWDTPAPPSLSSSSSFLPGLPSTMTTPARRAPPPPPPAALCFDPTHLSRACLSPMLQQWYRECGLKMRWMHTQLTRWDPLHAARHAVGDPHPSSSSSGLDPNPILMLLEMTIRLALCGAMEWAAVAYDRLVEFFRAYAVEIAAISSSSAPVTPPFTLSAEMESSFAAVKRLLLQALPDATEEEASLSRLPMDHAAEAAAPPPHPEEEEEEENVVPGRFGRVASFASEARHAAWQKEASALIFSLKRVVGDWTATPLTLEGEEEEAHFPRHDAEKESCPPPNGTNDTKPSTTTRKTDPTQRNRSVMAFLFQQFCLTSMDMILLMSGDEVLLREVCVTSDLSLMGYLVGYATFMAPCTLTPRRLRRVLERAMEDEAWQEVLHWRPSAKMCRQWKRARAKEEEEEEAAAAARQGGRSGRERTTVASPLSTYGSPPACMRLSALEEEDEDEDEDDDSSSSSSSSSPSTMQRIWPYLFLRQLLRCQRVTDVPIALRLALYEDIQLQHLWRWDGEVFDFTSSSSLACMNDERKNDGEEEDEEERESDSEEEDDDEGAAASLSPHWVSSPHVREWRTRFILTALGCFIGDLTAILPLVPFSSSSSSSSITRPFAVSPQVLVHRYQLIDAYLHLLHGLEDVPQMTQDDDDDDESRSKEEAKNEVVRWDWDRFSPLLWPVRLTLLLSSPLHDPRAIQEEVQGIGRAMCWSYTTTTKGGVAAPGAWGGVAAVGVDARMYFRLWSFIAGEAEIPAAVVPFASVTLFGAPRHRPLFASPLASHPDDAFLSSRVQPISWHPHSPVQAHYIRGILHAYHCGAPLHGAEEEEEAVGDRRTPSPVPSSTFWRLSHAWQQRSEVVRREVLQALVCGAVKQVWGRPTPQTTLLTPTTPTATVSNGTVVSMSASSSASLPRLAFLASPSSPSLLSVWWMQHHHCLLASSSSFAVLEGSGGSGEGRAASRLSRSLSPRRFLTSQFRLLFRWATSFLSAGAEGVLPSPPLLSGSGGLGMPSASLSHTSSTSVSLGGTSNHRRSAKRKRERGWEWLGCPREGGTKDVQGIREEWRLLGDAVQHGFLRRRRREHRPEGPPTASPWRWAAGSTSSLLAAPFSHHEGGGETMKPKKKKEENEKDEADMEEEENVYDTFLHVFATLSVLRRRLAAWQLLQRPWSSPTVPMAPLSPAVSLHALPFSLAGEEAERPGQVLPATPSPSPKRSSLPLSGEEKAERTHAATALLESILVVLSLWESPPHHHRGGGGVEVSPPPPPPMPMASSSSSVVPMADRGVRHCRGVSFPPPLPLPPPHVFYVLIGYALEAMWWLRSGGTSGKEEKEERHRACRESTTASSTPPPPHATEKKEEKEEAKKNEREERLSNFTKKNMHTALSFLCHVFERIKVHQSAFLGVAIGGIRKNKKKDGHRHRGGALAVDHDKEDDDEEDDEEEDDDEEEGGAVGGAGHTLAQETAEITRKIIHDACEQHAAKPHHPKENASLASLLLSSSSSSSLATLYAVRKCIGQKRTHIMEEDEGNDKEREEEEDIGEEIVSMIEAQKERQEQEYRIQGLLRLLMEA